MTVFSTGSYSGATTAEIAREAGISEPILYRHFASKRELYFACLDEAWVQLRQVFNDKLAGALPTPGEIETLFQEPVLHVRVECQYSCRGRAGWKACATATATAASSDPG